MSVALGEHPEWQGDWQMPAGIEQMAINTRNSGTGSANDPTQDPTTNPGRRMELFINGTSPRASSNLSADEEPTPETEETPIPEYEYVPAPALEPAPAASPKVKQPKYESKTGESGRLEGTITLDIDPSTGLIAVESCPVIRTRTFVLGSEPRRYCGPDYHYRPGAAPQPSRRGLTSP